MLSVGTGTPRFGRRRGDAALIGSRATSLLPPARTPASGSATVGPVIEHIDHLEGPPPYLERGRLVDILV